MRKKTLMGAAVAVASTVMVGLLGLGSLASATPNADNLLSPTGKRAVEDLRTCIAHTPEGQEAVLNVYYLVDASGSLFADKDGTDPDFQRADILRNSLIQLSQLSAPQGSQEVRVNYATGFFGQFFENRIDWTALTTDNAIQQGDLLAQTIRNQPDMGSTNWKLALEGAQSELIQQNSQQTGCSAIVWFTDGGININNDESKTMQAVADLCGAPVDGVNPQSGIGTFGELRQANVSVFGVLYSNPKTQTDVWAKYQPLMQPLIEGTGTYGGGQITCGGGLSPEQTAGAFIHAETTTDLALVFMQLSGLIGGGQPAQIAADGTFTIDPGVNSFQIVSSGDVASVQLTGPQGAVALDQNDQQCRSTGLTGTVQLNCTPSSRADFGTWKVTGIDPAGATLLLYGGLTLALDKNVTLVADSTPATVSGTIGVLRPDVLALSDYSYTLAVGTVGRDGVFTPLAHTATPDGHFSVTYQATGQTPAVTFRAVVTDVRTVAHKQNLIQVQKSVDISVGVPGDYPSIQQSSIKLSELRGRGTPATGVVTLLGPKNSGAVGEVCLPNGSFSPTIISDTDSTRTDKWVWSLTTADGAAAPSCITLKSGETHNLTISATNPTVANSLVKASTGFVLKSSTNAEFTRELPLSFVSTHNISAVVFWPLILALILLGMLLPLALLYWVNFATTKVQYGNVTRMTLDAQISPDNDQIMVAPTPGSLAFIELTTLPSPQESVKLTPQRNDSRRIFEPDLGTFVARISRWPFRESHFDIVAPPGTALITKNSGAAHLTARYKTGSVASFSGIVSQVWVLVIRESDLSSLVDPTPAQTAELPPLPGLPPQPSAPTVLTGSGIPAKLIIFDGMGTGGRQAAVKRLVKVAAEAKPSSALKSIVTALKARPVSRPKPSGGSSGGSTTTTGQANTVLPPIPGAGAPVAPGTPPGSGNLPPIPPSSSTLPPLPPGS